MTLAASCIALASAHSASAACKVYSFAKLPVTIAAHGPTTNALVNDHPVDLLVASGSFYSSMPKETAQSANVTTKPISVSFGFSTGKGGVAASMGYVDKIKFGPQSISNARFIVLGGANAPTVAMLGQNILGMHDIEYDLSDGLIRLSKPDGCTGKDMAYWAQPEQVRAISLEAPNGELNRQTIGKISVNGVVLRAMFSTSESRTAISSASLRKLGGGYGQATQQPIKADRIDIGGEVRNDVALDVAPGGFGSPNENVDLVIGMDFFLTHRVYVSNGRKTLFFTANGNTAPTAPAVAR